MGSKSPVVLPIQRIDSVEHAVEKLSLLEKVQGDNDWLATVSATTLEDYKSLKDIKNGLDSKRFDSYFDKDINGNDALRIRHIGKDSTLDDAVERTGLMGGVARMGDALQHNVAAIGTAAQKTFDKPIKILSGFYILSDLAMFASGIHTSQQSNDAGAVGFFKSFSSVMSGVQSAIFLRYGQDASVRHLGHLQHEINEFVNAGEDPYQVLLKDPEVKRSQNIVDKAERYFIDNPVKMGAGAWIIGQLGLAVAGGIQMHQSKGEETQHGMENIQRAALSIAGWLMLMVDEKHTEEKTEWGKNPIKRAVEEFRENPEKIASAFMMGASLYGLKASMHDADPYQGIAEISAITGDVAMFFVKKTEYGSASEGNSMAAAEAAAKFINEAPMIFTPTQETEMVHQLSMYLAERSVNEKLDYRGQPRFDEEARLEAIADMQSNMAQAIFSQIAGAEKRIHEVAHDVAALSNFFPQDQQQQVKEQMADAIVNMKGVYADKGELLSLVEYEHNKFKHESETPLSAPSMSVISEKLAELVMTLPPIEAGANATTLFDIAQEHARPSPAQDMIFNQSLKQQHAQALGTDVATLSQLQMRETELAL